MGRALFSQTYCSAPAVRSEPEPVVDTICQKWGVWNKFDPDSDEFFLNAEYEAFVDLELLRHPSEVVHVEASSPSSSSDSIDSASSDTGSPMATGPDDPAVMIAAAYPNFNPDEEWGQRAPRPTSVGSEWLSDSTPATPPHRIRAIDNAVNVGANSDAPRGMNEGDMTATTTSYRTPNRPRSASAAPALIPLSALLTQTRSTEQMPTPPRSPTLSVVVNVPAPVTVPVEAPAMTPTTAAASTPIPVVLPSLYLPTTPQRRSVRGSTQTMFSPSPPPSVTPRIYSWQSHPIPAVPTSPTTARGNRDGPLTNPHARRSFVRLGNVQAPVLVSNTAI